MHLQMMIDSNASRRVCVHDDVSDFRRSFYLSLLNKIMLLFTCMRVFCNNEQ